MTVTTSTGKNKETSTIQIKKTLWTLFMDGVQLPQWGCLLRGSSLLFTTKSPEIPCTHFIHFGRMKG